MVVFDERGGQVSRGGANVRSRPRRIATMPLGRAARRRPPGERRGPLLRRTNRIMIYATAITDTFAIVQIRRKSRGAV